MVLKASDELRHGWDDDPNWRESWYFNLSDPKDELGLWLYLWVVPNQPLKSGMLVCLYHGIPTHSDSTNRAWESPGHVLRGPGGSWAYCYKQDVEDLFSEDVDDVTLCGFGMKRLEPLKRYKLTFEDGPNASLSLDCQFMTRPWDFADNIHPTPAWLAKNRYHRGWIGSGEFILAGKRYPIESTGDSDHSWGTRDSSIFAENNLKTYALQSRDGSLSVKAQMLGDPSRELPRGYIAHGEDMQAVRTITERSKYDDKGVMHDINLRVEDVTGRVIEARLDHMYAAVAGGGPRVGYEGAGLWQVKNWGDCAGLASCWWASGVTREQLHGGRAGVTP
ncbi:MAG: hypothetical protein ACYC8V_01110 [Caulobacteraceae bacterium]